MEEPLLTVEERAAIDGGRWFSSLSASLRHDLLRRARVARYKDGDAICSRGDPAQDWCAVARGAVRVSGSTAGGKQTTLTYAQPGAWIGDVAIFSDSPRTHDAYAQGDTTLARISQAHLREILDRHVELYEALLRLNAERTRRLYRQLEELATLPLRTRLARQLNGLARSYGVPSHPDGQEVRIDLPLAQMDLAHLLGASRQRVNLELKAMERDEVIRIRPNRLVVRSQEALSRMLQAN